MLQLGEEPNFATYSMPPARARLVPGGMMRGFMLASVLCAPWSAAYAQTGGATFPYEPLGSIDVATGESSIFMLNQTRYLLDNIFCGYQDHAGLWNPAFAGVRRGRRTVGLPRGCEKRGGGCRAPRRAGRGGAGGLGGCA